MSNIINAIEDEAMNLGREAVQGLVHSVPKLFKRKGRVQKRGTKKFKPLANPRLSVRERAVLTDLASQPHHAYADTLTSTVTTTPTTPDTYQLGFQIEKGTDMANRISHHIRHKALRVMFRFSSDESATLGDQYLRLVLVQAKSKFANADGDNFWSGLGSAPATNFNSKDLWQRLVHPISGADYKVLWHKVVTVGPNSTSSHPGIGKPWSIVRKYFIPTNISLRWDETTVPPAEDDIMPRVYFMVIPCSHADSTIACRYVFNFIEYFKP